MGVGDGIAVAGTVIGLVSLIITVLVLFVPRKKAGPTTGITCGLIHDGMTASLKGIEDRLGERDKDLWEAIKEIRLDVKKLISKGGINI